MQRVLVIPAQKNLLVPTDRTVVLCASPEKKAVVHFFAKGGQEHLQLWEFRSQSPRWTAQINEPPSAGDFSQARALLVTFHNGHSRSYVRAWDVYKGKLLAELDVGWTPRPLDIIFDFTDEFYVYYETSRTTYVFATSSPLGNHSIKRLREVPSSGQILQKRYRVDDSHEWVVSGSQRICWIPTGYIGLTEPSHCWDWTSLAMVGQDRMLRKLAIRELSL